MSRLLDSLSNLSELGLMIQLLDSLEQPFLPGNGEPAPGLSEQPFLPGTGEPAPRLSEQPFLPGNIEPAPGLS